MKRFICILIVIEFFMVALTLQIPAAHAQKKEIFTWTGQSCLPPAMPVSVALQDLADRIKVASGGRLHWKVKPAGSICPATKEWQAIDKGVLDFAAGAAAYALPDIPLAVLFLSA